MITLNLLPDVKKEFIKAQRARATWISVAILVTMAAVGVTVLVALWVYGAQNLQKSALTGAINDNEAKLKAKQVDQYMTIQNQLANISNLHKQKNDFSRLLDFLPQLNPAAPNSIGLSSLDIDSSNGTIDLQGKAPNYRALTTFKDTLTNAQVSYTTDGASEPTTTPLFTNLAVLSSALTEDQNGAKQVSFEIKANYEPAAFVYGNKNVNVSVPNKDTTNSASNVPVFSGNASKEAQ
ncbi:MAG TPA: hypothetical protein VFL81_00065 [Candidatus Saccharimonadales bacterium]|nr:hypothetical protein [Candidatus Saccharimonadales bacterium]